MALNKPLRRRFQFYPIPETDFTGGFVRIDIFPSREHPHTVGPTFSSGLYHLEGDRIRWVDADPRKITVGGKQFLIVSVAQTGERFTVSETMAYLLCNFPLFNAQGRMNADAHLLLNHFKY